MRKKLICGVLVTCIFFGDCINVVGGTEKATLSDDVLSTTLLLEELLECEYQEELAALEAQIEANDWNYALTMESFYNCGNPYENINYEETIAALCTAIGNNPERTILDIDFLTLDVTETTFEGSEAKKTDRYELAPDGHYERTGTRYITTSGAYPVYEQVEDGHYERIGEEEIILDTKCIPYGEVVLTPATPESILEDVGLSMNISSEEYENRLRTIRASGVLEDGLRESVFVQVQAGLDMLGTEEQAQLSDALATATGNRKVLIETAASLIGRVPYQWGGKSSCAGYDTSWYTYVNGEQKGLDCSGYVQWCFRTAGFNENIWNGLLSTASIMNNCDQISADDLQIGDLGILNTGETTNHTGIYIGNGYFIHCNATDDTVSISKPNFTLFYRVRDIDTTVLEEVEIQGTTSIPYTDDELYLVAQTVWHEARGEGTNGWIGVAEVIKNRILSNDFANDITGVIYEDRQFSYNSEIVNMEPTESEIAIVKMVLNGELSIFNDENVLYFRNPGDEGTNDWGNLKCYTKIGNHAFYREAIFDDI